MRDYLDWHHHYDDPDSGMSWRLRTVQGWIGDELDGRPGPLRVLSVCAGDGRDVLEVLAGRDDADRVPRSRSGRPERCHQVALHRARLRRTRLRDA